MRILHGPSNIGGMPYTLSKEQKKLGHKSVSYSMTSSVFTFKSDIQLNIDISKKDKLKAFLNIFKFIFEFDVFHFYFGNSLTKSRLIDVPLLKSLGKKVFFYFCGCDIRDAKEVIAAYEFSACKHCWPAYCSPNRQRAYETARRYADGIFVSTPDLMEFIPGAQWLPQPVNLELLDSLLANLSYAKDSDAVTVAHAPTNRNIKGSEFIIKAVEELKKEGHNINLNLIENEPYEKALMKYMDADIVVDQLLVGWYGQVALEMMAMKKPVICYLRKDLMKYAPDVPIVSANIVDFKETLRDMIESRHELKEIGEKGRLYVEKYHDSRRIAKIALEAYGNAK